MSADLAALATRQLEANFDAISANLELVNSARWRLFRNHRLLRQNRRLFAHNWRLLKARQDAYRA